MIVIPPSSMLIEDQSTTTFRHRKYSKALTSSPRPYHQGVSISHRIFLENAQMISATMSPWDNWKNKCNLARWYNHKDWNSAEHYVSFERNKSRWYEHCREHKSYTRSRSTQAVRWNEWKWADTYPSMQLRTTRTGRGQFQELPCRSWWTRFKSTGLGWGWGDLYPNT